MLAPASLKALMRTVFVLVHCSEGENIRDISTKTCLELMRWQVNALLSTTFNKQVLGLQNWLVYCKQSFTITQN